MKFFKGKLKAFVILIITAAALFLFSRMPVVTYQGVDGIVDAKKIPLYVKVCGFLYRDFMYKDLGSKVANGISGDTERINACFDWTVENIKRVPEGFKVVDDHIWDIIVRGYGEGDQMADVFTTLTSYAGYPSFWKKMTDKSKKGSMILSFVKVKDKWLVFDVANGRKLVSEEDLNAPALNGVTYRAFVENMDKKEFDSGLYRPDKQKLISRIIFEIKNLLGMVKHGEI